MLGDRVAELDCVIVELLLAVDSDTPGIGLLIAAKNPGHSVLYKGFTTQGSD